MNSTIFTYVTVIGFCVFFVPFVGICKIMLINKQIAALKKEDSNLQKEDSN